MQQRHEAGAARVHLGQTGYPWAVCCPVLAARLEPPACSLGKTQLLAPHIVLKGNHLPHNFNDD